MWFGTLGPEIVSLVAPQKDDAVLVNKQSSAFFDRIRVSHNIALFDMQRQYVDVVSSEEVICYLENTPIAI